MRITTQQLIGLCRDGHLYHLAQGGSWPSVQDHGLLSTSALLDLFGYEGERRRAIESQHRVGSVVLRADKEGLFQPTIRDQRHINEARLLRCLEGCTPEEFYRLLNGRVFFWLNFARVVKMMKAYPDAAHDLIIIDAQMFINAYSERIELSHLNSGAARSVDHKRGLDLFRTLDDFPLEERKHRGTEAIAELTVKVGVKDISKFVVRVKGRNGLKWEIIWEREAEKIKSCKYESPHPVERERRV